jgi:segregation and condensation protein B
MDASRLEPALAPLIEAACFAAAEPLSAPRLAEVVGASPDQVARAAAELNHRYLEQARPYHLAHSPAGYRFALLPAYAGVLEKVYGGVKETRLSPPAIEALALVAYRQPATRSLVNSLRGAESGGLLRQLVRKGLVAVKESVDGEASFVTTGRFLDLFGLSSLEDLPRAEDLPRL